LKHYDIENASLAGWYMYLISHRFQQAYLYGDQLTCSHASRTDQTVILSWKIDIRAKQAFEYTIFCNLKTTSLIFSV